MYVLIGSVIMGMAFTNFGLTVREKCMVLPCIILFYAGVRAQMFLDKKKHCSGSPGFKAPQQWRVSVFSRRQSDYRSSRGFGGRQIKSRRPWVA